MTFAQTVVLAAFAGGTIFLGLPVGRLRGLSRGTQAALTTAAGGVILFLIYDVLSQAVEPVDVALDAARNGVDPARFAGYAAVLGMSVAFGLLSVTYVTSRMAARRASATPLSPQQIALGTAAGWASTTSRRAWRSASRPRSGRRASRSCSSSASHFTMRRRASPSPRR